MPPPATLARGAVREEGGGTHTMRMPLRAPVLWAAPRGGETTLNRSARLLFRDVRGPDVAVVQEFTPGRAPSGVDLRNFTGNVESVPPCEGHPQGRVLYGTAPRRAPDPAFVRMIEAQGVQPAVAIDMSWLLVGHVDETVHVVRARTERGWTMAVADPHLAVEPLRRAQRAGEGGQRLFPGTSTEHKPTVDAPLSDQDFLAGNEQAARHIDDQTGVLLRETGLPRGDLVRVPELYAMISADRGGPEGALACSPGVANGLSLTARHYAAPYPHGPKVRGREVFRVGTEEALAAGGVRVHWVENFAWSHLAGGQVHCATNALRDTSGNSLVAHRPEWLTVGARRSSEAVRVGSGAPGTQCRQTGRLGSGHRTGAKCPVRRRSGHDAER
ncbi:protein-arginine deiminase family protein [Streptomyces sp. NPDC006265]|uniref:protein-arginine deiminase family protein n=1 Tax=Streptomyces sp. NPDC006265 TaxID=3156740 RepID=UPI0033B9C774